MSLGSSKASSKAEAMWHPSPPWKSLMDALSLKGSPLSIGAESKAWGLYAWFSFLSEPLCPTCPVFCYFAACWVSSSSVGRGLPASNTSLPLCSLFLFGSRDSALGGKDGWGGGRGSFGGGGGSWGWVDFPGASFLGWDFIKSNKLLLDFLWIPILSKVMIPASCWWLRSVEVLSGDKGQLNTSNSSWESDKSTISSGSSSFPSSSSFSSSSSLTMD